MFREHSAIRRLVRLVTRPKYEGRASGPGPARTAGDRCGGCPACRAFVRTGPADGGGVVSCPDRGRPIHSLEALGPGGPGVG